MTLCQMCQAIPADIFHDPTKSNWKSLFVHHPSLKSLEKSSKEGCNLCSLFHKTITESRYPFEYPCQEGGPPVYQYFGLQKNVASTDGHRAYLNIGHLASMEFDKYVPQLIYHIGRNGFQHRFDLEFSDNPNSSTLYPKGSFAFSLATSWLKTCTEMHGECNIRYEAGFKPTRLVDVGRRGEYPRLVQTRDLDLEAIKYISLSHCWGRKMPLEATTTTTTLSKRLRRVPIKTLPRTFRDAIIATRRLGLQYIWIDSLCIVQDSPQDWQHESSLMGKVYSHSYCMIAAAASKDCHGGLFPNHSELPILDCTRQNSSQLTRQSVLVKPAYGGWDNLFEKSPLNERGWALQERELSPRIIYFTKHTMLFECREARGGEKGERADWDDKRRLSEELISKSWLNVSVRRGLDRMVLEGDDASLFHLISMRRHNAWRSMVEGYTQRQLSVSTDKFPGLSGLASEFAYLFDDEYVAGLWRDDLIPSLCWRCSVPNKRRQQLEYGPSWSWARSIVPVSYDIPRRVRYSKPPESEKPEGFRLFSDEPNWCLPTILNIKTVPAGDDPNGTLISAVIDMNAQLAPMKRSKTGNCTIKKESIEVAWDFLPQDSSDVWLLSLGRIAVSLVLVKKEAQSSTFCRVGIVDLTKWYWFEDVKCQDIALI